MLRPKCARRRGSEHQERSGSRKPLPRVKQFPHKGAVRRAGSDVLKSDDPCWIDQHITALLLRISPRPAGQPSSKQFPKIRPPHGWTHEIPELGFSHAVRVVELALAVHEKRPTKPRRFGVGPDETASLEGHDDDLNAKLAEALCRMLHLHEVPLAGQSPEVTVEHHQEPDAAIIFKATDSALCIGQSERHGGLADQIEREA